MIKFLLSALMSSLLPLAAQASDSSNSSAKTGMYVVGQTHQASQPSQFNQASQPSQLNQASQSSQACSEVIMTAHPDYPPYHWREGNHIVGASIELTSKILSELGVEYQTPYMGPWKRVLNIAKQGRLDLVVALKQTFEREKFLRFTTSPIFQNPFSVFVMKGQQFEFREWQDLVGRVGTKNAGDRYGNLFDQFARQYLTLEESYSTDSNFEKLKRQRVDYFIHGRYVGQAHLALRQDGALFTVLNKNLNEGFIHSGFAKNSPCAYLLPAISEKYAELLASGEAERILQKNVERWSQWQNAQRQ